MNDLNIEVATTKTKFSSFERFTKTSVWPAYVGCIWAFVYAVFARFYQAAGGQIGLAGEFKDPSGFYTASYISGVIIMICGTILITLVKPWSRVVPEWVPIMGGRKIHRLIILIPTLICTAFLIAHGVSGMITKAFLLAGIITIKFPGWHVLDVQSLALWDLFIYEPWFIIMGILAGLTAAHYAQSASVSHSTSRRGTILYMISVLLLTTLFVLAIIFDFGKI
ncbi:DUF3995 domain-containing protein [Pseudalkalibacillus decolorationis]|uniref:DUF3995 domain-containing protein n=1 Tax=Pseudalkalibacillus decolorationis TaxID=163879 RepID=UPI002148DF65|nr:DUF3995 domain-containing protein [Pseudalkalibacillus decolorationis]